ncbi:MAG TPA: OmpA family protein [Kofleriaceae bacterium]|nr:OmpA family protein [Kofleriaceae bacterium]
MRSRTLIVVALSGALAAPLMGCATAEQKAACSPLASWGAPAFRCGSAAPEVAIKEPPPPPPPPEPEPVKPPEPEPEPPPTASLKTEKIELSETVQFETDSAVLVERSKTLLDEVAREINDHPEVKHVQIQGYTDAVASKRHNLKLAQDRIASVKAYLQSKGVAAKRLTTKAFGEARPVADNKTEEGRAKNRRVEFHILKR